MSASNAPSVVRAAWSWSDGHMAAVRDVIVDHAALFVTVDVAPLALDQLDASDVVLTPVGRGRFGVRIRRRWYVDRRGRVHRDMTLRVRRGRHCEYCKVRNGAGDWLFVGASDGSDGLADWFVVDLDAFRVSGLVERPMDKRDNHDGTGFVAWSSDALSTAGCVVADARAVSRSSSSWPASVVTTATGRLAS